MADNHPPLVDLAANDAVTAVIIGGHRGNAALVEEGLVHPAAEVRAVAISAGVRLGLLDSGRLEPFLGDSDVVVRRRAAELAPRSSTPANLISSLLPLLEDTPEVAEMGAFALGEIERPNPAVVAALETMAISHPEALCRESAVAALGALHSGLPTILAAMEDKATVRRRAVIALAPFEGPEVDAALSQALEDRDWQVRQAAEDLLAQ